MLNANGNGRSLSRASSSSDLNIEGVCNLFRDSLVIDNTPSGYICGVEKDDARTILDSEEIAATSVENRMAWEVILTA